MTQTPQVPHLSACRVEPGNDEVSGGLTQACGFDLSAVAVEKAGRLNASGV